MITVYRGDLQLTVISSLERADCDKCPVLYADCEDQHGNKYIISWDGQWQGDSLWDSTCVPYDWYSFELEEVKND